MIYIERQLNLQYDADCKPLAKYLRCNNTVNPSGLQYNSSFKFLFFIYSKNNIRDLFPPSIPPLYKFFWILQVILQNKPLNMLQFGKAEL